MLPLPRPWRASSPQGPPQLKRIGEDEFRLASVCLQLVFSSLDWENVRKCRRKPHPQGLVFDKVDQNLAVFTVILGDQEVLCPSVTTVPQLFLLWRRSQQDIGFHFHVPAMASPSRNPRNKTIFTSMCLYTSVSLTPLKKPWMEIFASLCVSQVDSMSPYWPPLEWMLASSSDFKGSSQFLLSLWDVETRVLD